MDITIDSNAGYYTMNIYPGNSDFDCKMHNNDLDFYCDLTEGQLDALENQIKKARE